MITIISGSNRKGNRTLAFATSVYEHLQKQQHNVKLLNLEQLKGEIISAVMYDKSAQHPAIKSIQDEYFIPATKFWFFIPEYNGSFPGVLKTLIDIMSTRELTRTFKDKKASLTGVALGRAGNVRGMDHLAEILNHVGTIVHPNKKPISSIATLLNKHNELIDERTIQELEDQAKELITF